MPLRQLQRPLLRTTIAAAAAPTTWRPIAVQLLHGSSCCRYSSNSTSSGAPSSNQPPPQSKKTLFEELFPDEPKAATHPSRSKKGLNGSSSHDEAEPEPLPLSDDLLAFANNDKDADAWPAFDDPAILVLGGAPKSLTESDFFRTQLGRPARHVEGWSSTGIHRVIPVRDSETLEPSGQYYILFESGAAAAAWQHEVSTLWRLARVRALSRRELTEFGSGSSTQRWHNMPDRLNPKQILEGGKGWHGHLKRYKNLIIDDNGAGRGPEDDQDRDEAASVRNFTLVPQSQRYDLERPLYSRLETFLSNGAPSLVERLMDRAGSRHLVLLVLEGGRLSVPTLRALIREDGVDRNLPWRVKGLDRDYHDDSDSEKGQGGIMAFGKSALKASEQTGPRESLLEQAHRAMGEGEEERDYDYNDSNENSTDLLAAEDLASLSRTARERRKLRRETRRWNRFLVPFLDEAEARRFVRHWHRRQFQLNMGHEDSDVKTWEESRTVNASILW
ncbi:hypothetical protein PG985_004062 [Apiospora marii]|uniref:Uncharacterized protein n=1 Tax=Apiospora marii TaxID=335849 RepID=A0ABR1SGC3_9PEZI